MAFFVTYQKKYPFARNSGEVIIQNTYIDQFLSLFTYINFICVKAGYWQNVLDPFDFDLPLKIQFLKSFKNIVESSLVFHSIGNFVLKNNKIGHFLIKQACAEIWHHGPILWRHIVIWRHIFYHVCLIEKWPILLF